MGTASTRTSRKPKSRVVAAADERVVATPPQKPEGITGGGNMSGRLQYEPNSELRDQSGLGRAGTYDVGEWQLIALSNPYVAAGLDFILAPVADARVDVEPPADEALPEGQATLLTDFVRWAVTEAFRLSLHTETAARGFLLSGFSLFEPTFHQATWKGRDVWALKALDQRLPNSLSPNPWHEDAAGVLKSIRQQGPVGGSAEWKWVDLAAARTLLYSWKREGNNWAGVSQLRPVWYIAGRVMPMMLKLAGVTLQREGAGLPIATAKDAKTELKPEQRQQLVDLFANHIFHESAGVVMPSGWDLSWVYSPGANKGHVIQAWRDLGLAVLQQLGAQQLVLGTESTGSRSVGETHDARSMAFVRKVLRFVEAVLNGDSGEAHVGLVRRLVDANFGPQPAYPRIKLTPQRPEMQPDVLATAVKTAIDAGLMTPRLEDENVFRERTGFAPITEEERAAEKAKKAALAPQIQPGFPPRVEQPAAPPAKPALVASAQRVPWKPWRPLRASEEKVKLSVIDDYFTRQRDEFAAKAKPIVVGMLAKSASAIDAAMADGDPSEVASLPLDVTRLDKFIREFLADTRRTGAAFAREELLDRVKLVAAEEEEQDRDRQTPTEVVDDADEVQEAQAKAVSRRIQNRLRSEIEREAIDTLRTGGDAGEVVSRVVDRQVDTGAFKGDAGSVVTKVFNIGRDEAARLMGGVAEVELSAILDSETCEVCVALDGTTAPFNSPEHDRLVPPVRDCKGGDNCRCLLVFIPAREGDDE